MILLPIIVGIVLLVLLVTVIKLDTFVSFMVVCLLVGIMSGLPIKETLSAIQTGIGNTLGSLVMILGLGAMLGKLVAESGAAIQITNKLVNIFGLKNIQLALIVTGFIVGIPMFYTVGFVVLVPLVIAIAHRTGLPLLYVGLPMLASLSVTHGFLPPHPAPTAVGQMYGADLGLTLIYGIIASVPAIWIAKVLLGKTMQRIKPELLKEYVVEESDEFETPSFMTGLLIALIPVLLIGGASILSILVGEHVISALGEPALAMLIAVLFAIYFLGVRTGRTMTQVMKFLTESVASVAGVLLIIAGAGAFKQIMVATEASDHIGNSLVELGLSPYLMAWLIAAIIRVCVGSATVAALTAGGIMVSTISLNANVSPELLVLATGAGSITFSHINDGGFWLFKEYFNVSIKETLQSWTLMETTVSVVGLAMVFVIEMFI